MGRQEDFYNFDLARLTLVGWLTLLLSIPVGIVAAILVGSIWDTIFPPTPGAGPRRYVPAIVAGFGGAVGFFFVVKIILNLAGITLMRPKSS